MPHMGGGSNYPPPPMRHNPPPPTPSSRPSPGASGPQVSQQTRNVPLEQVIDDVANMGFSRHEVKEVVLDLMNKGQSVDLNIVLDRLMHARR